MRSLTASPWASSPRSLSASCSTTCASTGTTASCTGKCNSKGRHFRAHGCWVGCLLPCMHVHGCACSCLVCVLPPLLHPLSVAAVHCGQCAWVTHAVRVGVSCCTQAAQEALSDACAHVHVLTLPVVAAVCNAATPRCTSDSTSRTTCSKHRSCGHRTRCTRWR